MAVKSWINGDRVTATDLNRFERMEPSRLPADIVANGVTDDTAAIQSAIDALGTNGGIVEIPGGNARITSPLQIRTNGVILWGNGLFRSRIYADGCNGVEVAAGVSDLHMLDVEVVAASLYSNAVNTLVGVKIDGTTASHCQNFVFRDVFCNGFETGFYCRYLWSSRFDNCRTLNGKFGLVAYGLSVNNEIAGGSINVTGAGSLAGSRCVALRGYESATDSTPVASEGWIVKPTLMDGADVGVEITGNAHIEVGGIIDHCGTFGVLIQDNGVNYGGNCDIHPTYIAMNTAGGVAAIRNANTVNSSTLKRTRVHDTLCVVYSGDACTYGINQSGARGLMIIEGNSLMGFATADIYLQSAGNIVGPNDCQSAITNNVSAQSAACLTNVQGENGHVWVPGAGAGSPFAYVRNGNSREAVWSGPPTINSWNVSDRVRNSAPAAGQPKAWVCTVAGTPGTWVSEGNL